MAEGKNTVLVREIKDALKPEFEAMKIEIKDSLKPEFEAMKIEIKDSLKPEFEAMKIEIKDSLKPEFEAINNGLKELNEKYDGLHEIVIEFRKESFEQYDKIYRRLDFTKAECLEISAGMRRIEEEHRIIDHKTILKEIQQLKSRN